jgi:hypothetical protein
MRCNACAKTIDGLYYTNPLFGDKACQSCVEDLDFRCMWCGRFKETRDHFGKPSCHSCMSTSITTDKEIAQVVKETLPILETHLGPNSYNHLPVTFGIHADSDAHPLGLAFFGGDSSHIRLWQGMPRGFAIGVLAHEYGHMALNLDHRTLENRPGISSRSRMIEEGFCEVMCAVALLTQKSDDARFMSFLMPGNPDPVYGDGFRMMWPRALELGSVAALLQELTGEVHPFRGPRPDVLHDDFTIPDDIAPLVEIGSGDRDKGVLRGTALHIKDLPEGTTTGPRLRGKGLAVLDKDTVSPPPAMTKGTLRGTGLTPTTPSTSDSPRKKGILRGKGLGKK